MDSGAQSVARDTAATCGLVYLDYRSMLPDEHDGWRGELSADGVHLMRAAYIALTGRLRVDSRRVRRGVGISG